MTTDERADALHVSVGDVELAVHVRGDGPPLLLLSGEEALELDSPFVAELARERRVYLPAAPGFGRSSRPDWIAGVDDVAYVFLELVARLGTGPLPVVGASLGGWIAAAMAIKGDPAVARLVLIDPYGIKPGGPTAGEIADVWYLPEAEVRARRWVEPARGLRDLAGLDDEQLTIVMRNAESFARFCWEPYLHDPSLLHQLYRIHVPTLLIWGERDGIVDLDYAAAYRAAIAGAELAVVPNAAHYPHLEQPEAVLALLRRFLAR